MFDRKLIAELRKWKADSNRKPLIIRGARQVGKTTLVEQFSKEFEHYIKLNLELSADRAFFGRFKDASTLLQAIFFESNLPLNKTSKTLLFIDEIQEEPSAFAMLRYIKETFPDLAVIAAGSLLESLFNNNLSFPVGRVTFKVLRPLSFEEFLHATGESEAVKSYHTVPVPDYAINKLFSLFHLYAITGGMPEVVKRYTTSKDLTLLNNIYDSLIVSYIDDVEKYAGSQAQTHVIRHCIRSVMIEAGRRIKFAGFGNSNYRSREVGEALRTLQKALLIHLVYPVTSEVLPLMPDNRKSPRLQFLDTGLMNYFGGIQKELIGTSDLCSVQQGRVIEHLVGQEILANRHDALSSLYFWVREKTNASAEVDFIVPVDGRLVPAEVKSGSSGKLRSLHLFMDQSPLQTALRFYKGAVTVEALRMPSNKNYRLINLPYFLAGKTAEYFNWAENHRS